MPKETEDNWLYSPGETQTCTDSFFRFISEYDKIVGLFLWNVSAASKMDEMRAIAAEALAEGVDREKPKETFNKKEAAKSLRKYAQQLSRNLVINMVDNFQCYLSEILQEVTLKKHEILKSSERVTTERAGKQLRINYICYQ